MADFYLVQNDAGTTLTRILQDNNGPIDLTGATVTFNMRDHNGIPVIADASCSTTATPGQVIYTFQAADTAKAGTYSAEFEIAWGAVKRSVPTAAPMTIQIRSDLG